MQIALRVKLAEIRKGLILCFIRYA